MRKFLGYIFTPIHYLFFGLLLGIFHPIQWICLKLGGYSAHKRSVDILNGLLILTYPLVGATVRFRNPYRLPTDRSIVFVCNHQSMYDIPPLIWFLRKYHAKFISKIELTKGIPSISFNQRHSGGANIDRKDSKQAIAEITKLTERMSANTWSVIIYPEGTRARDGKLKPFAIGGLATLLREVPGALVVPLAINNSWRLFRYGAFPLSFGERLSWTILEPIEPADRSAVEVLHAAEAAIHVSLGQVPFTPSPIPPQGGIKMDDQPPVV